jgi:transcriptional regulator with XRE-family HTH domain
VTVGERITAAMKRLGLNNVQLAKKVGVSRQAVANWKTDVNVIRHDKIPPLAAVLGLHPSDLSPYGGVLAAVDEEGKTDPLAYLRRIDNNVSRMSEDIGHLKDRIALLEDRITSLESMLHKRLDGMQK